MSATASQSDDSLQSLANSAPEPSSSKSCRFFAKGKCKKGDNCRFRHCPPTTGVNSGKDPPKGLYNHRRVKLDVHLTESELARLREEFPSFFVVNGAKHLQSPHAYDRAERALVSRLLSRYGKSVLEVQGRYRVTDAPTRDVCRKSHTDEDDEAICPEKCEHMTRLADGHYDTIVTVDAPLQPDSIRTLLKAPGVKQIVSAIHVHTSSPSQLGSQRAVWVPRNRASISDDGSIGQFQIDCPGRQSWLENDHAWITLQKSVKRVKPEIVLKCGTYHIVRFVPCPFYPVEPIILPSIWATFKKKCPTMHAKVAVPGRGGVEVARIGDDLLLLKDDNGWFSTTGEEARHAHDLVSSRPLDSHLRRKLVSSLARDNGGSNAHRLTGVVMECEAHDQLVQNNVWDNPSPSSWISWLPFGWLFAFTTRRSLAQKLLDQARGYHSIELRKVIVAILLFAVVLALVPWPWYGCESRTSLGIGTGTYPLVILPYMNTVVRVVYPTFTTTLTSCGLTVYWGGPDVIVRVVILVTAFLALPSYAYASHVDVRIHYELDRFAPIHYNGPLPEKFGLPGYISNRPLKELSANATITIKDPVKWVDIHKPKDNLFAVGVVFGGHLPSVTLPCQHNLVIAARNRQLAEMPAPNEKRFKELAKGYLGQFRDAPDMPIVDYHEWNDRFPTGRRKNHDNALQQLGEQRYNNWEIKLRNVFTKTEKILRIGKGEYDPRVINGASDPFNVIWGPWFYFARQVISAAYDDLPGNVLLACGKTSRELGAWFVRATASSGRAVCGDDQLVVTRGIFIEADGSRHDAHMHELFFELKWDFYEKVLRHIPRRILRLAKEGARNTVARSRSYGVKWSHPYRVRSGDPDTERGNSVCTDFVASQIQEIVSAGHMLDTCDLKKLVANSILALGYEITMEISRDPTDVTFLSGGFMPVDGVMYWYPLPGRQLVKMGWSMRDVPLSELWKDYAGVLNSYRDYSFVPFLRVYVDVVSQLVPEEHRLAPPSKRWLVGPGITPQNPASDTWDWFTRRYSLTQSDEEEFKAKLLTVTALPHMLDDPMIQHMVEVDMA